MKAAGRSREARIPAAESALRLLEGDEPFATVDSMAGADGLPRRQYNHDAGARLSHGEYLQGEMVERNFVSLGVH
mgnify:CR=1 FL=1